jgi:hypothetical protein
MIGHTDAVSRDLPRHAAVDEGNAADQNGTGSRAALICSIPLIHWPGFARPQVAYGESALWRPNRWHETHPIKSVCICVLRWLQDVQDHKACGDESAARRSGTTAESSSFVPVSSVSSL